MGRRGFATLAAVILLWTTKPQVSWADCPLSCIDVAVPSCTTDGIRSASTAGTHGSGPGQGSYNLPAGTLSASGTPSTFGGGARVDARDNYQVLGIAAGTPLSFTVELEINAQGSNTVYFSATLLEGASNQQTFNYSNGGQPFYFVNHLLVVPVNRAAGEVFQVASTVIAGTGQSSSAATSGALRFAGLPPGAKVVSCQGYLQDFPVPALPASWGALKAQYR